MAKDEISHAERIKAAIDLKEPDRVPVLYPGSWAINFAGNNLNFIGKKEKDVSFSEWINNPDIFVKSQVKGCDRFNYDFVMGLGYSILPGALGCAENEPYWGIPSAVKTPIIKVDDWKKIDFPDMKDDFVKGKTTGKIQIQLEILRNISNVFEKRGSDAPFITGFITGPLTLAGFLLGVDKLMLSMIDSPDETKELINFCTDVTIEYMKKQFDAGADHIFTPDPTASGDLISAKFYKEFAYPAAQKQSRAVSNYKDKYAHHYHICGNTSDRWDLLESIGSSFISLDSVIDLKKAKDKIGKTKAIAGNLNPSGALLFGTETEVEKEGKEIIENVAPNGGYLLWTGCDWALDYPLKNVEMFYTLPKKIWSISNLKYIRFKVHSI
ncbi:MAG: hypothetical protein GX362_06240 [Methanosarcinaceae archaeon]|nr:hypothetical protein [Methanosarcinaceae archaeon]